MTTTAPLSDNIEKLKNPEEKDFTPPSSFDHASAFDYSKIKNIIQTRREKLLSIKSYISLKTFHALEEKIEKESELLEKRSKEMTRQSQEQNKHQALPKAFFEKKHLKAKIIRID